MRLLFLVLLLAAAAMAEPEFKVKDARVGEVVTLTVRNPTRHPVSFRLLCNLDNCELLEGSQNPVTVVLRPGSTTKLMKFRKAGPGEWRYTYQSIQHKVGRLNAKHNTLVAYSLPFRSKKPVLLNQGYHGEATHNSPGGEYALDFLMPVGTHVVAAREGWVVRTEASFKEGGFAAEFRGKANMVVILHDDGTLARYVHLDHDGVRVAVGQRVKRGHLLARSGNTGYSSRPHLHFDVYRLNDDFGIETLPVRFRLSDSRPPAPLKERRRY